VRQTFSQAATIYTYPVLSFANLENAELLATGAQHDQPLDFIVYLVCVVVRSSFLPVGSQGGDELLPVYQALPVTIEEIGDSTHLQTRSLEFYELQNQIRDTVNTLMCRNKKLMMR